jgi:hypothetical protein
MWVSLYVLLLQYALRLEVKTQPVNVICIGFIAEGGRVRKGSVYRITVVYGVSTL